MPQPPRLRVIEGGRASDLPAAERPSLALGLEFVALGVGLTLTISWMARLPAWFHHLGAFQALFVAAFGFYALALWRVARFDRLPHVGVTVFAVALATRLALLPATPSLSGDLYRYVWEGRVSNHGCNPYRHSPADPSLASLRDPEIYPRINHKELSTIYPPLGVAGFALVARVSESVLAFKAWVIAHDLALVLLLLAWARQRGSGVAAVIAYAWNPLVLVEYAGTGHNDPTAMVWLVLAFLWLDRRPMLSAAALSVGVLVKLAPLLALPFLARRWPWRARLLAASMLLVGLGFFWRETRATYSGLIAYWGTWRNNELLFHLLERASGSFTIARGVTLALVAIAIVWAWRRRAAADQATRLASRVALLGSPVFHPWYLGWTLFYEPFAISWPWILLSFTSILNYGLFSTPAEGRSFHLPLAGRILEFGLPLLLALTLAGVGRARRARAGAR